MNINDMELSNDNARIRRSRLNEKVGSVVVYYTEYLYWCSVGRQTITACNQEIIFDALHAMRVPSIEWVRV